MNKRKTLALLILVALLISSLAGYTVAKFVMDAQSNQTNVTFTARLARKVAVEQKDKAAHLLIPGLDISIDPYVSITGKTDIPAYLFLEVTDSTPNAHVHFALSDNWINTTLRSVEGKTFYIYSQDKSTPTVILKDYPSIPILKAVEGANGKQIRVDQYLLTGGGNNNDITFHVYLDEKAIYDNPGT